MISCGNEVERLRNIASDVIRTLEHLLVNDLEFELALREWDFRRDTPRVVDEGHVSERSLTMVRRSDAVIVILGEGLPEITRREIKEALAVFARGAMDDVFVFLDKDRQTQEQKDYVQAAAAEVGKNVVWAEYTDDLNFQSLVQASVLKFVLRRILKEPRNAL
jgi:hypothetical protein